jgi:hypothetical protein
VILTKRSEVDSESRRQPAVFIARSTQTLGTSPPSLLSFAVKPMAGQSSARADDKRPGQALIDRSCSAGG